MEDHMNDYYAHESAYLDAGARVGSGETKTWLKCLILTKGAISWNCTPGQNVAVAAKVRIGSGCKIQHDVSMYECVVLEDNVLCGLSIVFPNVLTPRNEYPYATSDYPPTLVGRGTSTRANATIVCGVTLNECAFVAADAVVTKDVPAYAIVARTSARITGWMSACSDSFDFGACDLATDSRGRHQKMSQTEVRRVV
jgi:UDP-2-acetamido-3-amino-2,3-dideoxy-glucuronate N-acetyltransferase